MNTKRHAIHGLWASSCFSWRHRVDEVTWFLNSPERANLCTSLLQVLAFRTVSGVGGAQPGLTATFAHLKGRKTLGLVGTPSFHISQVTLLLLFQIATLLLVFEGKWWFLDFDPCQLWILYATSQWYPPADGVIGRTKRSEILPC